MAICECILSDTNIEHLKNLQKNLSLSGRSETVELLLKYLISNVDSISSNDFILIDDYFSEHPSFLHSFYNDFMISATFNSSSYFGDIH